MRSVAGTAHVREVIAEARRQEQRIAFVPTMGNLHPGHIAMAAKARTLADFTVVSIFVNPFQFGPGEDYQDYPRTLAQDEQKLADAGVDFLFVPSVNDLYPDGLDHVTRVEVPVMGEILCGVFRPTFFRGVTTVVAMLFNLAQPDYALFGEKDYQQLVLITRMVRDLQMPLEIVPVPTIREPDGLAMSSRNTYLDPGERQKAPTLFQALTEARDALQAGNGDLSAIRANGLETLKAAGFQPDYFEIRRAADLAEPHPGDQDLRILAAARLGQARLIDNLPANYRA